MASRFYLKQVPDYKDLDNKFVKVGEYKGVHEAVKLYNKYRLK